MKRSKKLFALVLSAAMIAATAAGCSTGAATAESKSESKTAENASPAQSSNKQLVIGLSMNTQTNPFFVSVKEGAQKGAEELGAKLVVTDAQNDASTQMKDVENLITQKPDLIIIDPADSDAIVAAIQEANDAKIPVITIDRAAKGGDVVSHMGFNAIKAGGLEGQFIADTVKGKGNVVEIQGIMGTNVAQDRSKGFNDVIAKYPDIKKVATQSADFDRAKAMKVMENILQANKNIQAVYAANDEMALGCLEAIEAAGRTKDIVLVGNDCLDDTMKAIKEDKMKATINEPPYFLGKTAVQTAVKYLKGDKVEKSVILESTLVTKDNVDSIKTRD